MRNANYLWISAALTLIILYDLYSSLRGNGRPKELKYALHSITNSMNYATIALVICALAFNFYVYWITGDTSMLYIAYWMLLLLIKTAAYIAKKGGIGQEGIWYSGSFYEWQDIKGYYCDKTTGRIGLSVVKRLLGYKYRSKLRLQAERTKIEEINELISEKVG